MAMTPEERRKSQAEWYRRWSAANPDKVRERNARHRAANLDKMREKDRRYRAANPEKRRDQLRSWMAANPGKKREYKIRQIHGLRPEEKAEMYEAQQGKCYLCAELLPADPSSWYIDHDHRCDEKRSCRYCRRGLACHHCNTLIGLAFDDPERLRRIAGNLEAALADVTRRLAHKPVQAELYELPGAGEL